MNIIFKDTKEAIGCTPRLFQTISDKKDVIVIPDKIKQVIKILTLMDIDCSDVVIYSTSGSGTVETFDIPSHQIINKSASNIKFLGGVDEAYSMYKNRQDLNTDDIHKAEAKLKQQAEELNTAPEEISYETIKVIEFDDEVNE